MEDSVTGLYVLVEMFIHSFFYTFIDLIFFMTLMIFSLVDENVTLGPR